MNKTWTCKRCRVVHWIHPERVSKARENGPVFRCEMPYCDVRYIDRNQSVPKDYVRMYIEAVPKPDQPPYAEASTYAKASADRSGGRPRAG